MSEAVGGGLGLFLADVAIRGKAVCAVLARENQQQAAKKEVSGGRRRVIEEWMVR